MRLLLVTLAAMLVTAPALAQQELSRSQKPIVCMAAETFAGGVEKEKLKGIVVGKTNGIAGEVWSNGETTYFVDRKGDAVCIVGAYSQGEPDPTEGSPPAPKPGERGA